jgi:polyhydroxyalkanoate synthesis regulator phasin
VGTGLGVLGGVVAGLAFAVPGVGSASGLVLQQDDTGTDATTEATTGDADAERGVRLRELLQELVDGGTITADQADAVTEHLVANAPERGGRGPHRAHAGEAVAEALGLEVDEVRDALRAGTTIADLAEQQGVDVQVVIDAMVAEAEEHLATAVENGRLTQEEADERLVEITERITDRIDDPLPAPGDGHEGRRGGPGPFGG